MKPCVTLQQLWSACRGPAEKHPRAAEAAKQFGWCWWVIPCDSPYCTMCAHCTERCS